MNEEMTELLIGKFLDGEITPAEQRLLDAELRENSPSRKLLEELQRLHELTEEALSWELTDKGASAEEIFSQGAAQTPLRYRHGRFQLTWRQQAAAGAAAALLLGLSVYLAWSRSTSGPVEVISSQDPPAPAQNYPGGALAPVNVTPGAGNIFSEPVLPVRYGDRPDFYFFRGPDGAEWLIERPTQNQVRRAVYHGDIH